nr:MAG TPA: hypothetical protein [Caudoviricetes sp.]
MQSEHIPNIYNLSVKTLLISNIYIYICICYDMRSVYEVATATVINAKRLYQGYSNLDRLYSFLFSI